MPSAGRTRPALSRDSPRSQIGWRLILTPSLHQSVRGAGWAGGAPRNTIRHNLMSIIDWDNRQHLGRSAWSCRVDRPPRRPTPSADCLGMPAPPAGPHSYRSLPLGRRRRQYRHTQPIWAYRHGSDRVGSIFLCRIRPLDRPYTAREVGSAVFRDRRDRARVWGGLGIAKTKTKKTNKKK